MVDSGEPGRWLGPIVLSISNDRFTRTTYAGKTKFLDKNGSALPSSLKHFTKYYASNLLKGSNLQAVKAAAQCSGYWLVIGSIPDQSWKYPSTCRRVNHVYREHTAN
jgi:hypothetical protein